MLCRVSVQQLWRILSRGSLLKSDKSRVNFIDWRFVLNPLKTGLFLHQFVDNFQLKLEAHPGEVHVSVVIRSRNVGHLEGRRAVAD